MQLKETLVKYIDEHLPEMFEFLRNIVSFDSTNLQKTGREAACQEYIKNVFLQLGVDTKLYSSGDFPEVYKHHHWLDGRDSDNRPNVTAHIPGGNRIKDPDSKGMMLTSHTDTMPAGDLSLWKHNPFEMYVEDGKMYGLGISDDKAGAVVSYIVCKAIKELNLKLQRDLYFTTVSDEEYYGCNGSLLACMKYPCDLYVNLDGCDYGVQVTGLGGTGFELIVTCDHETASAEPVIDGLYKARLELEPLARRCYNELESHPLYAGTDHAKSAYRIMEFASGSTGTNVDIGNLKIVIYTTSTVEEIKKQLDTLFAEKIAPYFKTIGVSSKGFTHFLRSMNYAETKDTTAAKRLAALMSEFGNRKVELTGAPLSDLNIYLFDGADTSFNVGLLREFKHEGGAHKPNEFIYQEELIALSKAMLLFVTDWCGIEE
jgi:acetylornithine deacetylase/succinyl-diaminopimelate desuccinylase-like protein